MKEELFRSRTHRVIAGVCGGIGEHFNIDPTIIRVLLVILSIFHFSLGALLYILGLILLKENPYESEDFVVDTKKNNLFLGAGLIFLGILSLIRAYIGWFDWKFILPVALIVVGLFILFKNYRKN